jgi:hypothetical protein
MSTLTFQVLSQLKGQYNFPSCIWDMSPEESVDCLCGVILDGSQRDSLVSELLSVVRGTMCDEVAYPITAACHAANITIPLKQSLEQLVAEELPVLLTHNVGVFVIRELALRNVEPIVQGIMGSITSLLRSPLGCELISWLVSVSAIGTYVVRHWEVLVKDPVSVCVVSAVVRVPGYLRWILDEILTKLKKPEVDDHVLVLITEMLAHLDLPDMQRLVEHTICFRGRGMSIMLEWVNSIGSVPRNAARSVLEYSQGISRVLLVDHLRTFSFYFQESSMNEFLTKWSTEYPNYNEAIVVMDERSGQVYTIDIADTKDTASRRVWLKFRGKVEQALTMCYDYQLGGCELADQCSGIHIDQDVVGSIRLMSCCVHHGQDNGCPFPEPSITTCKFFMRGYEISIPSEYFARTVGFDSLASSDVIMESSLCLDHDRDACRRSTSCTKTHMCREVFQKLKSCDTIASLPFETRKVTFRPDLNEHSQHEFYQESKIFSSNAYHDSQRKEAEGSPELHRLAIHGILDEAYNSYCEHHKQGEPDTHWHNIANAVLEDIAISGCRVCTSSFPVVKQRSTEIIIKIGCFDWNVSVNC